MSLPTQGTRKELSSILLQGHISTALKGSLSEGDGNLAMRAGWEYFMLPLVRSTWTALTFPSLPLVLFQEPPVLHVQGQSEVESL